MQLPSFDPRTDWQPPRLVDLPSWAGAKRVAVDIETRDPQLKELGPGVRRGSYIVGVSFAIEDGPAFYLPIRHEGGDNMNPDTVLAYLQDQAAVFHGDIVGANLQYDLDFLAEVGVEFQPKFFRDVQIAEPLLDELQFSYSLDAIAARHGMPGKAEEHLRVAAAGWGVDPKAGLWQLPARHVGAYAEQDARLPLQLLRRQERMLEEQDLWRVYDLESRVLPVLLKMRRRGVRVDLDRLAGIERWSLEEEGRSLAEIARHTGIRVSVEDTNRATALEPVLLATGVTVPRTAKAGLPQVTTELLEGLGEDHAVARAILRARRFNKLRNTFAASIRRHVVGDRIHATFNQLRRSKDSGGGDYGARYGRLSCVNPNLQQQPSRDKEIAPRWRSVYLPDEGAEWACLDYSQQEPRWLLHFAGTSAGNCGVAQAGSAKARVMKKRMGFRHVRRNQNFQWDEESKQAVVQLSRRYRQGLGWDLTPWEAAIDAVLLYHKNPSTDTHQMMADLTGIPRKDAKQIYLALIYGMGGGKLCRKLGLPTKKIMSKRLEIEIEVAGEDGQALLDKFNMGAPFIRVMAGRCEDVSKNRGYITTISGRRCRFPRAANGRGYDWTYRAMNRLIQGSSGDQVKAAMVRADQEGIPMQLQIHDEITLSIHNKQEAGDLAQIMLNAVPCNVPHRVDIKIGPSWGEAK